MGKRPKEEPVYRKATTVEGREAQCIALAYDLAEQRLREGTATAQEVVHFLRMGSPSERKKQDLTDKQIEVLVKKAEAYDSAKRVEELYSEAISAVTRYRSSVPRTGEIIDE